MSSKTAHFWTEQFNLAPHPEGGFYRETYRSRVSTAIYFLLKSGERSLLHRIKSDEMCRLVRRRVAAWSSSTARSARWHFYDGSPLILSVIHPDGALQTLCLGRSPEKGAVLQAVVPGGCWFGGWVSEPDSFTLAGCTVAPPFEFKDFELADRQQLIQQYPQHQAIIEKLTKWND